MQDDVRDKGLTKCMFSESALNVDIPIFAHSAIILLEFRGLDTIKKLMSIFSKSQS